MTHNPTREEIIDAHEALRSLVICAKAKGFTVADKWGEKVAKALPPRPKRTMADIGWGDSYHMAEATNWDGETLIMLGPDPLGKDEIDCLYEYRPGAYEIASHLPDELTPTGTRWEKDSPNA